MLTVGLALLGVGYGAALIGKGLDPAAGLFAAGLVAVAELAFWAIEPGAAVPPRPRRHGLRVLVVGSVALGSALAGTVLLVVVSDPDSRGGRRSGVAGVLAVLAIFGVAVVLARSLRSGVG